MEDNKSRITFSGVNPPQSTVRIIEAHILKWIHREQSLLFLPLQHAFQVHIDREDYRLYTCHIEIRVGSREWSGLEEGKSIHEAVLKTLKHLRPLVRLEILPRKLISAPTQAIAS